MIRFLYGKTGTDRSGVLIQNAVNAYQAGHPVYLLVPDRAAVRTERLVAEYGIGARTDVITFTRLCNLVFRRYGGICKTYIDKGAKKIMMARVLETLSPSLLQYKNLSLSDTRTVEALTEIHSQFIQYKIDPRALEKASLDLAEDRILSEKLSDFSTLFAAYDSEVKAHYDDPDSMLSECCEKLRGSDFFRDAYVFADSFAFFTPVQYDILSLIFRSAADVTVSLSYDPQTEGSLAPFASLARTDKHLRSLIKESGREIGEPIILKEASRYRDPKHPAPDLAFLAASLWHATEGNKAYEGIPENIRILSAKDTMAEAEAVALDIARRVREGARYRDFAVIMRSRASYEGQIDAMLGKYGIPYFFSGRSDILRLAPIRFLFSALDTVRRGYRKDDFLDYLGTGLTGIGEAEADALSVYLNRWSLFGSRLAGGEVFALNPEGFDEAFDEKSASALEKLNKTREAVLFPLAKLYSDLAKKQTVREHCRILYGFYESMRVAEQTKHLQTLLSEAGETGAAAELSQCHGIVCSLLDRLVACSGEAEVGFDTFVSLLKMMAESTEVAGIPNTVDEVLVTEANAINFENVRYTYLIGAAEGEFPSRIREEGFFSEREKTALEGVGIDMPSRLENRLSDELYFFYASVCSAREGLTVAYPRFSGKNEQKPSAPIRRLFSLFPALKEQSFEAIPQEEKIERPVPALEYALSLTGPMGEQLRAFFENNARFSDRFSFLGLPLSAKEEKASPESVAAGSSLSLSYSRLEQYIKCRFSYFCQGLLRLRKAEKAEFSALNVGQIMHKMMEVGSRLLFVEKNTDSSALAACIDKTAADFIGKYPGLSDSRYAGRLVHVVDGLKQSALAFLTDLAREFEQSGFRPADFELAVGFPDSDVPPLLLKSEDGSGQVSFHGIIDRVDTFRGSDGKMHVRVIDYKTGKKEYKPEMIAEGLDLQMLLYLFTLCENGKAHFGAEPEAAGAVYVSIKPLDGTGHYGKEEHKYGIERSGILTDNEEVLREMDKTPEKSFLPKKKKNTENKLSQEQFSALKEEIKDKVLSCAAELRAGEARSVPKKEADPCRYCPYRPVCRVFYRKPKEYN